MLEEMGLSQVLHMLRWVLALVLSVLPPALPDALWCSSRIWWPRSDQSMALEDPKGGQRSFPLCTLVD